MQKRCCRCQAEKDLVEFSLSKTEPLGRQRMCKECCKTYKKAHVIVKTDEEERAQKKARAREELIRHRFEVYLNSNLRLGGRLARCVCVHSLGAWRL